MAGDPRCCCMEHGISFASYIREEVLTIWEETIMKLYTVDVLVFLSVY
jgi:hypothetical protein